MICRILDITAIKKSEFSWIQRRVVFVLWCSKCQTMLLKSSTATSLSCNHHSPIIHRPCCEPFSLRGRKRASPRLVYSEPIPRRIIKEMIWIVTVAFSVRGWHLMVDHMQGQREREWGERETCSSMYVSIKCFLTRSQTSKGHAVWLWVYVCTCEWFTVSHGEWFYSIP